MVLQVEEITTCEEDAAEVAETQAAFAGNPVRITANPSGYDNGDVVGPCDDVTPPDPGTGCPEESGIACDATAEPVYNSIAQSYFDTLALAGITPTVCDKVVINDQIVWLEANVGSGNWMMYQTKTGVNDPAGLLQIGSWFTTATAAFRGSATLNADGLIQYNLGTADEFLNSVLATGATVMAWFKGQPALSPQTTAILGSSIGTPGTSGSERFAFLATNYQDSRVLQSNPRALGLLVEDGTPLFEAYSSKTAQQLAVVQGGGVHFQGIASTAWDTAPQTVEVVEDGETVTGITYPQQDAGITFATTVAAGVDNIMVGGMHRPGGASAFYQGLHRFKTVVLCDAVLTDAQMKAFYALGTIS